VSEYDHRWPDLARVVSDEITAALDGALHHIEHIGSTSVPGLAAKPLIDLMSATTALADVASREPALHRLGYRLVETGMRERLLYRRDGGPIAVHLHVVLLSSWAERNERLLRDHLRRTPDDAARYAQLKRDLAATGLDPEAYTRAKTNLIQELTDRARSRLGMPLVPVWEDDETG